MECHTSHITKPLFVTFFPGCENIHLTKDVGMMPYIMYRDMGYDAVLVSYRNGDYPYLDEEVPGLRMKLMKKRWDHVFQKVFSRVFAPGSAPFRISQSLCTTLDAIPWLVYNGRKINVLQLYHIKEESVLVGLIYRLINPKGKLYLKLDLHPSILDRYQKDPDVFNQKTSPLYNLVKTNIIKLVKFNVVTVESQEIYEYIRSNPPFFISNRERVHYLPNGIDNRKLPVTIPPLENRENVILHIGRLGSMDKRTDMVLEAFAAISDELPQWKLVLIGPPEDGFSDYFSRFIKEHENLADRIIFVGYLKTRKEVFDYYIRSKIIAFPSRYESFGLVIAEAGACGVVPVATQIPSLIDLTDNGRLGYLCPIDDTDFFTNQLRYAMSHDEELREKSHEMVHYIQNRFEWSAICSRLQELLY